MRRGAGVTDPRLDASPGGFAQRLVRVAAALLPLSSERPDPGRLRRVLVVRTDERVGNALLTLPLAMALRDLLPAAEVHLLLAARCAAVAEGLQDIHIVRWSKTDAFRHPLRFLRFLRDLRRRGFDAVIDAAHWHAFSLTSALLSRWATRRWVVGADRGPARVLYSAAVPPPPPEATEVDAKFLLLRGLGLAPPRPPPPLRTRLGEELLPWADGVLGGAAALLNPGARKPDRRWPAAQFAALARILEQKRGLRSIVTWGPGEEDLARLVVDGAGGAAFLAPPTDLRQLAALLRRVDVAVTNDTGPLHLAVACGAPVLALLHAEEGRRWTHRGPLFAALVGPDATRAGEACERLLDTALSARKPAPSSTEAPSA
jgi:ADP-heptose:LPS heptosyltransferase